MDKTMLKRYFQMLLTPGLMLFLGVVLLIKPDEASWFLGRVLSIILLAAGILSALQASRMRELLAIRLLPAVACLLIGLWLFRSPLALAEFLGKIAGLLLLLRGIQDIVNSLTWKTGLGWAVAGTAIGALLLFVPMTASRLVLGLCGAALILVAAAMAYGRFHKPRIIDPATIIDPEDIVTGDDSVDTQ